MVDFCQSTLIHLLLLKNAGLMWLSSDSENYSMISVKAPNVKTILIYTRES